MKVRYYVTRNRMPTAHEVATYRAENGCTMAEAKAALLDESKPRLQYCDASGNWHDVETVIEVFG